MASLSPAYRACFKLAAIIALLCAFPSSSFAQCDWGQISLYVNGYYSLEDNSWHVYVQGEDLAAGCCYHVYTNEVTASTQTSSEYSATDTTTNEVHHFYEPEEGPNVTYTAAMWIGCICVNATVAFEEVPGQIQLPTCDGEPALMANEYIPGVAYLQGVTPRIGCPQFENHSAGLQYLPHFTWGELNGNFQLGNPHTGWGYVNGRMLYGVTATREVYDFPIYMSSGYRCPQGNQDSGGVPASQHMQGRAVDLYRQGGQTPPHWTEAEFNALKAVAEAAFATPIQSFTYDEYADRHYHVAW